MSCLDPAKATDYYSRLVPGWSHFSPEVKFAIVSRLQRARMDEPLCHNRRVPQRRPPGPMGQTRKRIQPTFSPPEGYLSVAQVQKSLGICHTTVYNWCTLTAVREYRVGRRRALCLDDLKAAGAIAEKRKLVGRWEKGRLHDPFDP